MRGLLGPADVADDVLEQMVRDLLEEPTARLVSAEAEPVDYAIPSITTAGRYWVRGVADVAGEPRDWRIFVKHVQSWSRSPFFAAVPEEVREWAAMSVPWRTEGSVYRSGLAADLPDGLSMARPLGVFDLDELSQAIWMAGVVPDDSPWDLARDEQAAYLLGRMAASPAVAPHRAASHLPFAAMGYVRGRLAHQVLPQLREASLWPPETLAAFGEERQRLIAVADRAEDLALALDAAPRLSGHGDACPNNLLVTPGGFTLIDFGFWGALPIGFDLTQLVIGDVQIGRRSHTDLVERDEACTAAYHAGLAAEGYDVDHDVLRRVHAVQLMLYAGLSSFTSGADVATEALERQVALARYSLDLLEATG